MVLAMLVGGVLAIGRLSRRAWVAKPAGAWVEHSAACRCCC